MQSPESYKHESSFYGSGQKFVEKDALIMRNLASGNGVLKCLDDDYLNIDNMSAECGSSSQGSVGHHKSYSMNTLSRPQLNSAQKQNTLLLYPGGLESIDSDKEGEGGDQVHASLE